MHYLPCSGTDLCTTCLQIPLLASEVHSILHCLPWSCTVVIVPLSLGWHRSAQSPPASLHCLCIIPLTPLKAQPALQCTAFCTTLFTYQLHYVPQRCTPYNTACLFNWNSKYCFAFLVQFVSFYFIWIFVLVFFFVFCLSVSLHICMYIISDKLEHSISFFVLFVLHVNKFHLLQISLSFSRSVRLVTVFFHFDIYVNVPGINVPILCYLLFVSSLVYWFFRSICLIIWYRNKNKKHLMFAIDKYI